MKLLGFEITRERRSLENPAVPLGSLSAWAELWGGSYASAAGEHVTTATALGVPAVWGAVSFLSDTVASLPLSLYRRTDDGGEKATGDPLHRLLHDAPNDELTSHGWRKLMMGAVLTTGRHVSFIERSPSGRVLNLWPLDPATVSIERVNGRLRYMVNAATADGRPSAVYGADEVLDIAFMRDPDGVGHRSPLYQLRNAIGLALALEGYASRFFQGGGVPPMQLIGGFTSPTGAERAAFDVSQAIRQAKAKGHNVLPLPTGHELKPLGFDPDKGQLIEARRFQIEEVARIYGLPPTFLQDFTRATFSNAEHSDHHLTKHTIMHWVAAIEQELNLKLFGASGDQFAKFNLDGLLRGDFATRMAGYATSIQNAVRTPNEVRSLEELPPLPDGDKLMIQGATVSLEQQLNPPEPVPEPAPEPAVEPDLGDEAAAADEATEEDEADGS